MMSRRQMALAALVAPVAALPVAPASPLPAALSSADPDPWVRLCAERRMLHELAEGSVIDGNIPEAVEDACWPRVAEIDAEIAASQPASPRGLAAAMAEYLHEIDGCTICDQDLLRSLFSAALALAERVSA